MSLTTIRQTRPARITDYLPMRTLSRLQKPLEVARANPRASLFFCATVFFSFAVSAFLFSMLSIDRVSAAIVPTSVTATSMVSAVAPEEIHIGGDGLVLLRSAQIVSINGTTLTVSTSWGSTNFIWQVQTNASQYETHNFGTEFLTYQGGQVSLSDFKSGDKVIVTGTLATGTSNPTIEATAVRQAQ